MAIFKSQLCVALAGVTAVALADPAPTPSTQLVAFASQPQITPPSRVQRHPTQTYKHRRDLFDSLGSGVNSVLIPNFFQDFPTGDAVQSSLGLDDQQVALPTNVLNLSPYGNWTDQGWNVRFHGNVYKQPNIPQDRLNDLANIFLIDVDIETLPPEQQDQARNMTASIFVIQQEDQNVTVHLEPAPMAGSSGEPGGGGAVTPGGGSQDLALPYPTTEQGDFDVFLPIANTSGPNGYLMAGNATNDIQRLNVYANGTNTGNATAYLVPPTGLTIISDVDDILRVTKIYDPAEGLLNSFARPFVPWMNMPEIYANWSRSIPDFHFHYLTTTPEQVTRNYMDFIFKTYPGGSFDTRPLNFSDVSATLSIRAFLLNKIFDTFPQRKFILVADTSNSDVMRAYPQLAVDRPNQVQCIFLRNTSATDADNYFPYDTSGFENLNQQMYMFFNVPDDLRGLDIANGQCYNQSVPQNVTFGFQDEALGIHGDPPSAAGNIGVQWLASLVTAFAVMGWLFV